MSVTAFDLKWKIKSRSITAGAWAVSGIVAILLAVGSFSALLRLYQHDRSPAVQRSKAVLMSARASHAFTDARAAISASVSARTLKDHQTAVDALKAARHEFSRAMARAADAADGRRVEILARRAQGETLIGPECAPWTHVDDAPPSKAVGQIAADAAHTPAAMRAATRAQLLFFKTCLTDTSRFQQTLDDQTSTLVAHMTKAAAK